MAKPRRVKFEHPVLFVNEVKERLENPIDRIKKERLERQRLENERLKRRTQLYRQKTVSETYTEFQKVFDTLNKINQEKINTENTKKSLEHDLRYLAGTERKEMEEYIANLKPDLSSIIPKKGTIDFVFFKFITDIISEPEFASLKKEYEDKMAYRNRIKVSRPALDPEYLDILILEYRTNYKYPSIQFSNKMYRFIRFLKKINYKLRENDLSTF